MNSNSLLEAPEKGGGTVALNMTEPKPHPVWQGLYECFGEKYGELDYCPKCRNWWQCKYKYHDERF